MEEKKTDEGAEQVPSHEIVVNVEEFKKYKVWIATPMYGGMCYGEYMSSIIGTMSHLGSYGVRTHFDAIFNESLITRARNYCADKFLRSDADFLIFIDSDISFNPASIMSMIGIYIDDPTKKIICAPYCKKDISWEKIDLAVKSGLVKNPKELEQYVGDFVINFPPYMKGKRISLLHPVEVMEAGTGMMLIHRSVFNDIRVNRPDLLFVPDHVRDKDFNGVRKVMAYFDTMICPDTGRYLSEDYMFCRTARECGHAVWVCPWINLVHIGTYHFRGNMRALAGIGASLTVDPNALKAETNG